MRLPPYADLLGVTAHGEGDERIFTMPFGKPVLGRPGFVHGGAIAALLEFAALGTLGASVAEDEVGLKPINITVTFMRGATERETFAAATVTRLGKRVANVEAHAWQEDRGRPIASAQMNVLLRRR